MSINIKITQCDLVDLPFIDSLQKSYKNELGFIPFDGLKRDIRQRRILKVCINGNPVGYIYFSSNRNPSMTCHQICVKQESRGLGIGKALLTAMEEYANQGKVTSITAKCAYDLDSNKFWQKMGYTCVNIKKGGKSKNRKINIWKKQIQKEFWEKFYDEIKISEKIKNILDIILFSLYGNTRIILKQ